MEIRTSFGAALVFEGPTNRYNNSHCHKHHHESRPPHQEKINTKATNILNISNIQQKQQQQQQQKKLQETNTVTHNKENKKKKKKKKNNKKKKKNDNNTNNRHHWMTPPWTKQTSGSAHLPGFGFLRFSSRGRRRRDQVCRKQDRWRYSSKCTAKATHWAVCMVLRNLTLTRCFPSQ